MSAHFIIEYAGCPLRIVDHQPQPVTERQATPFMSEADAWLEAGKLPLPAQRLDVVNLYERQNRQALCPTTAK